MRIQPASLAALALALLAPTAAAAQPAPPGCPNVDGTPCPIDSNDLCAARVIAFEPRIKQLGEKLHTTQDASRTKADEDKVAAEFGSLLTDCRGAVLKRDNALTQGYLYRWLQGIHDKDSFRNAPTALPMRSGPAAATLTSAGAVAGIHLDYYGGHVIPNAKVVAVFWGPNVDATTQSSIGGFYSSVLDSPYMDWLSEYDTNISAEYGAIGTQQHIGRGTFAGAVTIAPSITATSVTDAQVQAEINAQIDAGHLPAPDANTLYMTYFPSGTSISRIGRTSCQEFCAYHGSFTRSGSSTFYGVMPDLSSNGCETGCGTASTTFERLTAISSHELIEAVTDPEVALAASTASPRRAWFDPTHGEIGDICNHQEASIAGYNVQKEWDNATSSCIVSSPASVSGLTLMPSSASVVAAPGAAASLPVRTALLLGPSHSVSLSVTGLPAALSRPSPRPQSPPARIRRSRSPRPLQRHQETTPSR